MEYNKLFDHTNLNPWASLQDIRKLCDEAREFGFYSVCVNPYYVPAAKKLLEGTGVKITAVVGFPLGSSNPKAMAFEAKQAVKDGADEIDMVQNISMARAHNYEFNVRTVAMVRKAIGKNIVLKVILENCYLTSEEIKNSCIAAVQGGADFVKTSTGFGSYGAKADDVKLMRDTVGPYFGVKAAGGIHTLQDAMSMVAAGANRIGCSRSVAIMNEVNGNKSKKKKKK